MRRLVRADAVCLRVRDHSESSKLVTLLTAEHGRVNCIAKGARRPRSKFGAALDVFALARVIYYWHENRSLYTVSDAELVKSHAGIALLPGRFVAAQQITEFVLRTVREQDPHPSLFGLLTTYLDAIEAADTGFTALVCSFLLKAASFAGFRPELQRCLVCRNPVAPPEPVDFDALRGGIICARCRDATRSPGNSDRVPGPARSALLAPADRAVLCRLLYTPAEEIRASGSLPETADPLPLVLSFVGHHFDPLVLHSFRWPAGLS